MKISTSKPVVKILLTILRMAVGWYLLYEGMTKVFNPDWTSFNYLSNTSGFLSGFYHAIAANPVILRMVDLMNAWGLVLIGLGLFVGLFVRFAAAAGTILLALYYFAYPPFGASLFFSTEASMYIVDRNLIKIMVLLFFVFTREKGYGLDSITGLLINRIRNRYSPSGKTSSPEMYRSRLDILKNLATLPVLGALGLGAYRVKERYGIDALSGATNPAASVRSFGSIQGLSDPSGHPVNQPFGQAVGIFPGRVVWAWDKSATRAECTNTLKDDGPDFWFQDKNTDQARVSQMISLGIQQLTGKSSDRESWDEIFRHYNRKNGKGDIGYKTGEKIFLKLNCTASGSVNRNTMERNWEGRWIDTSETSPQIVQAVIGQLVNHAGVPQEFISVGDPQRNIYQDMYEKLSAEFPEVKYLGNNIWNQDLKIIENGRTPLTISDKAVINYSDKGTVMTDVISDNLYGIFDEMEYMLNLPMMKGHNGSGISAFPKNHFGSQARGLSAVHLHGGLMFLDRFGYGKYRVTVDIMGSKYLGKKNLVYILDSLWPGPDWGDAPVKFGMSPFNDHWASSIFFSFDPVAIESVAFDFLRTELDGTNKYTNKAFPNYPGCDDYLQQAASEATWPAGIIYSPNGDGEKMASLGVHEHWNNPIDKKYTRNLGTGSGIELIPIFV